MNKKEHLLLSSKAVALSEHKGFLQLVNRICYYDEANLNGVILPSETAEEYASTLVDMPVYAHYMVNESGQPSFGGHEPYLDEDGEIAFNTEPIGVHVSVEIKNDDVEVGGAIKNLPCLFATQKIWTRNKNVVKAVKRLFTEDRLYNSWEISVDAYTFQNEVKRITEYSFLGNCFLGVDNDYLPAYGPSAKVLSLSSLDANSATLMVANAVARDISDQNDKKNGGEEMDNKDLEPNSLNTENTDTPDTPETNTEDQLTSEPKKKRKGCADDENTPEEKKDPNDDEGGNKGDSGDDGGDDDDEDKKTTPEESSHSSSEDVTVESLSAKVGELSQEIANLTEELGKANETISELSKYKELFEESEKQTKISELENYVRDSGWFTDEEIASPEIHSLIEKLDKGALAEKIADRAVESTRSKKGSGTEQASIKGKLFDDPDTQDSDSNTYKAVMANFFNN